MAGGVRAQALGAVGEEHAAALLREQGYRIVKQNYHSPYGEVDIIAADGESIVFVEVKTRRAGSMVSGEQAVDARKQRRIITTALLYLQEHPSDLQPRFDVIAIEIDGWRQIGSCRHYEGAFDLDDYDG